MADSCAQYVSTDDLKAAKESILHIEHVATSKDASGNPALTVTDPIRGTNYTNTTLDGLFSDIGFKPVNGSFEDGGTLVNRWDVLLYETNGSYYQWSGDLPHTVPPGSSPYDSSGELITGWVDQTDLTLRSELNIVVKTVPSITDLLDLTPRNGQVVNVMAFHLDSNYGGGEFKFDAASTIDNHTGGDVININAPFPIDWNNESQQQSWFYPTTTGNGAWIRQNSNIHDITNYGAKKDGTLKINTMLNRMADSSIAVFLPRGKYVVESFTRNIPPGGNINQTSLIMYGEPTYGSTDQHYSWETCTVIQGAGDMFLDTVNTAVRDILFRNTPDAVKGKIFTLGAYAQCEMANCIFGPANYHFYNAGFGFPGYNVKPFYRNCRFYGAEIYSRYFEGTVAGYHEQDCYTSHNKRGTYLAAPVSSAITDCIYEYNDDGAILLDLYGYTSASYQLAITNTFFETNGAGPVDNYKARSDSHITVRSVRDLGGIQPATDAAPIRLIVENCSFTDVTTNQPAFGAIYIDSKTATLLDRGCRIEPAISAQRLYTANQTFLADPLTYYGDTLNSIVSLDKLVKTKAVVSGNPLNSALVDSFINMNGCGFTTKTATVVTGGSVNLIISTLGGVMANGDVLVTLSGGAGFASYKLRLRGTSSNHSLISTDSDEVGGFTGGITAPGHVTNYTVNVQNNGPTANVTVSFIGHTQ